MHAKTQKFLRTLRAPTAIRFIGFFMGPAVSAVLSFAIVPLTTWMVVPEKFGRISMYTLDLQKRAWNPLEYLWARMIVGRD